MANEITQIPNPSTFVGTESTGYGRQNTKMAAGFVGLDTTAPYINGDKNIVIPVGGIVEVNGVLYKIETESILTREFTSTRYYIYLEPSGTDMFTPVLTDDSGVFNPAKNARYTATNRRVLDCVSIADKIYKLNKSTGYYFDEINPNELIDTYRTTYPDYLNGFRDTILAYSGKGISYGIAVDQRNGNILINTSSAFNDHSLYVINPTTGATITSFSLPNTRMRGIVINYGPGVNNLISVSEDSNLIYVHSGITSSILTSFACANITGGISIDRRYGNIVSADVGNNLIKIHDGISGTILTSFSVGSSTHSVEVDPWSYKIYTEKSISGVKVQSNVYLDYNGSLLSTFDTNVNDSILRDICINPLTGSFLYANENNIYISLH